MTPPGATVTVWSYGIVAGCVVIVWRVASWLRGKLIIEWIETREESWDAAVQDAESSIGVE